MKMWIKLDEMFGYEWAINRTKLSYKEFVDEDDIDFELARKLVRSGPSHSKFLRCMTALLTIDAPRYWWLQFDTYRIGVTELSQSTMHTILKRPLTQGDFQNPINENHLDFLNGMIALKDFDAVKNNLPEGFLQTRGVCTNYQTLRTIYGQRRNHKLAEWTTFCNYLENMPMGELIYGRNT